MLMLTMLEAYGNHTTDQIRQIMSHQNIQNSNSEVYFQKKPPLGIGHSNTIKALMKDHEFVFFYAASCPHCRVFDPVFAKFLTKYPFKHMDFTMDGNTLPGFERATLPKPDLIAQFFPGGNVSWPTVFLVNTKTLVTYVVSMGEKTYPEFLRRMKYLAPDIIRFNKGVGR